MRLPARAAVVFVAVITAATFALVAPGPAASAETLTGTLVITHEDDLVNLTMKVKRTLIVGAKVIPIKAPHAHTQQPGPVRVRGSFDGARFEADTVTPLGVPRAAGALPTRRVAVILFNFTDDRSEPWTAAQVNAAFFAGTGSVRDYYLANGQLSVTGDVFGWFPLAQAKGTTCSVSAWQNEARILAVAQGVNLAGYQSAAYAWPRAAACPWTGAAGLAPVGSSSQVTYSLNGTGTSVSTAAHELGHNLGFEHASGRRCTRDGVPVVLSASCTDSEYGDLFSNMGSGGLRLLNNIERADQGWLPPPTAITADGTYTLGSSTVPGAPNATLEIPRASGGNIVLEYRTPGAYELAHGNAADFPMYHGVMVRIRRGLQPGDYTFLLDTTPATITNWDSPLAVGQTFTDQSGVSAITVTTVSLGATSAQVQIRFNGTPTTTTTVAPSTSTTTTLSTTTTSTTTTTTTTLPGGGLEGYTTGDDSNGDGAWASFKLAQVFTASTSRSVSTFQALVLVKGSAKPTCEVWATTGNPARPSARLAVGAMAATGVPSWATCTLSTAVLLTAGTRYALVIGSSGGNSGNAVFWRADTTSPTYTGGHLVRSASSGAWVVAPNAGRDHLFRVP